MLRDGLYTNPTYGVRDIWKQDVTMRINQLVGTAAKPITITAETPGAVTLKGDGLTIFQLRQCSYVKVSGLVIEGEVERITVADAKAHQFIYKDGSGTIKYRVDPNMTDEQIGQQVLRAPITATRPSLFNTGGLLVQDSAHIEIVGCTVGYAPGTGLRCQGCDYLTVRNCTVHNSSRRSSSGTHGLVLHTLTSAADGFTGVRVVLDSNTIRDNYNEVRETAAVGSRPSAGWSRSGCVLHLSHWSQMLLNTTKSTRAKQVYSWSELKTFITPEIDEGKGLTIQKSYSNNGWTIGRVVISNNVCYGNGFSGIHLNQVLNCCVCHQAFAQTATCALHPVTANCVLPGCPHN